MIEKSRANAMAMANTGIRPRRMAKIQPTSLPSRLPPCNDRLAPTQSKPRGIELVPSLFRVVSSTEGRIMPLKFNKRPAKVASTNGFFKISLNKLLPWWLARDLTARIFTKGMANPTITAMLARPAWPASDGAKDNPI